MRDEIKNSLVPPPIVIQEWAKTIKNKSIVKCNYFEMASDVPDPRDVNTEDKNLMIFNDLLLEKQNKCECYYLRGRHSNVDCFYLSQNYDMTKEEFRKFCKKCWKKPHGFVIIDRTSEKDKGKYTEGFDNFFIP